DLFGGAGQRRQLQALGERGDVPLEHDRAELALAVSAGVVGVGGVLAHQCGHGRLLRVEADAVVEGGDVDGPPASYLGGADGAVAGPVADGVDGDVCEGGGFAGGEGGGHRGLLSASPLLYTTLHKLCRAG